MQNKTVRKITMAAMLIVLDIILTAVPRYFEVGAFFSFNRITLGPATTIFASLVLGPLYGGLVGGTADLLSWIIFPNSGAMLNIFITVLYILLGILPYFVFKLAKKWTSANEIVEICIISAIYVSLISCLLFADLFDQTFLNWGWNLLVSKIVISIVTFVLMIGTIVALHFINKKSESDSISIALVCIVCEICLMVFLKPLSFWLYSRIFYGKTLEEMFGVSFSFLVLMALLFSCAMIPLNTFFVNYIKQLYSKFEPKE